MLSEPTQTALSGTVESHTDLGLPALPSSMGGADELTALLTGTHTLRVWTDGEGRSRVAVLGRGRETDVYVDPDGMWLWSSSDLEATRIAAPDKTYDKPSPTALASAALTPADAAEHVLAAVDDTTDVTTTGAAEVAGRPVYELVLTPHDAQTLVARATIAIDAETHIPLRVQVFSTRLADPAVDVGFTSVDFGTPDASTLTFTPPPGITVTDTTLDHPSGEMTHPQMAEPTVLGTGWSRVVVATLPPQANLANAPDDEMADAAALLDLLTPVSGSWGSGRALDGTLFSVVLTDDGRVAVGAVDTGTLTAALAAS